MFFLSLLLSSLVIWFTPWWGLAILGFAFGLSLAPAPAWTLSAGAAVSAAVLAFLKDGQSHGLIGARLAGLFHLPSPYLVFLLVALFNFLTLLLTIQAASHLRRRGRGGDSR